MGYITFAHLTDAAGNPIGTGVNPLITKSDVGDNIHSLSGSGNAVGDHIIIPAIAGHRIKVLSLSAFAPGGTPAITATFTDDIGGDTLFTLLVQAPNQAVYTFGIATSAPSFLFATSVDKPLNMRLSGNNQVVANMTFWVDE